MLKVIVWGLFACLMLFSLSICWVAVTLPYGQATTLINLNSSIIQNLMIPTGAILALFAVALKELLTVAKPKEEDKKD